MPYDQHERLHMTASLLNSLNMEILDILMQIIMLCSKISDGQLIVGGHTVINVALSVILAMSQSKLQT